MGGEKKKNKNISFLFLNYSQEAGVNAVASWATLTTSPLIFLTMDTGGVLNTEKMYFLHR